MIIRHETGGDRTTGDPRHPESPRSPTLTALTEHRIGSLLETRDAYRSLVAGVMAR